MLYAALLGFGIFFAGWGIAFVVSLVYAPAQLDAATQTEISRLSEQLSLPDKALAEHLTELLAQIDETGKKIVQFVLMHDTIAMRHVKIHGLSFDEIDQAAKKCLEVGLLVFHSEHADRPFSPISFWYNSYYYVPVEFRETLKRLLYSAQEKRAKT